MKQILFTLFNIICFTPLLFSQEGKVMTNLQANNDLLFPSQNILFPGIGISVLSKTSNIAGNKTDLKLANAHFSLLNNNAKLGINVLNKQQNTLTQNYFGINFTYKINLGNGLLASCLGINSENINLQNLNILDIDDANIPFQNQGSYWQTNILYALSYQYKALSLAFSANKNLSANANNLHFAPNSNQHYLLHYYFPINTKSQLETSLLVRTNHLKYFLNDYLLFWSKPNVIKIGFGYRTNQSMISIVDLSLNQLVKKIPNQFVMSYAFDYPFLTSNSFQSHEIMLRYFIPCDNFTKKLKQAQPFKSPVFF